MFLQANEMISQKYRNFIKMQLVHLTFTLNQFLETPHQHLRMDWCYREKLLDGNCLGEKFD